MPAGIAYGERRGLDGADQVEDPPVLQPHLVVEESAQLFGDLPNGALRPLGRLRPLMVDGLQPLIVVDGIECRHPGQQSGQIILTRLGKQKVVERLEVAALVGG